MLSKLILIFISSFYVYFGLFGLLFLQFCFLVTRDLLNEHQSNITTYNRLMRRKKMTHSMRLVDMM